MLTRDDFTPKFDVVTVDVPGYGAVGVRSLSGRARNKWLGLWAKEADKDLLHCTLFASCLCDENGAALFDNPKMAEPVLDLPMKAVDALVDACMDASGLGKDSEAEAEKNSEAETSESGMN